jgi:hypothetical protein
MYSQALTGRQSTSDYAEVLHKTNLLVELLEVTKSPDSDRTTVVRATLQSLQTGQIAQLDQQIHVLASRLPDWAD